MKHLPIRTNFYKVAATTIAGLALLSGNFAMAQRGGGGGHAGGGGGHAAV